MSKKLTESEIRSILNTADEDLVRKFPGLTRRELRAVKKAHAPDRIDVSAEVSKRVEYDKTRMINARHEAALREIRRLQSELDAAGKMPEARPADLTVKTEPGEREATAVAVASDWHAEERVVREKVNGLNEYNLDIFHERSSWFFTNTAKLLRKERKAIPVRHLVLIQGGDMTSSNIHDDLMESNQLGPIDAMTLVQDHWCGGIKKLLEDVPDDVSITVILKCGNHPRITTKQRVQTEEANSLEWYTAHNLARYFEGNKRVKIVRDRAYHTYLDVYGRQIRIHHGHAINYQGGVGGITIPVNKAISEWNKGRPAYLDIFGHFHQLFWGPNFIANGSLIGYSPYAVKIKAPYQDPAQAFCLLDSKFGLTVRAPILLEAA